jgi:hypothetical protein
MTCVELSLFPKEQREACKTFPVLRQNACCISECARICNLVCCVLLLPLHPTLRKNYLQNISRSAIWYTLSHLHNSYSFLCNPLFTDAEYCQSRISRPDPSSVLFRQKLEIISTIEITFSHQVLSKTKGGEGCPCLKIHISASQYFVQLLLHYHTSTSSSLALLKHTGMPSRFFAAQSAPRTPLLRSHSAPIAFSPHSYALLWVC